MGLERWLGSSEGTLLFRGLGPLKTLSAGEGKQCEDTRGEVAGQSRSTKTALVFF